MECNQTVEIYVATHKKIEMKMPDYCRKVQVNCARSGEQWEGYIHDHDGISISEKNPFYCELTALYWGWKNSEADIKGLCHYRRFFSNESDMNLIPLAYADERTLYRACLTEETIKYMLAQQCDVILPMQYSPYPDTVEKDLEKYCYPQDIDALKRIFQQYYPEYLETFHVVLNSRNMSYCNMFIARKEIYNQYCEWLFDVLEHVEKECDLTGYDTQHQRVYGYLAEVLLNVYMKYQNVKCEYVKLLVVLPAKKLSDRLIYSALKLRSRFHKYMFEHQRYGGILIFNRLFRKTKYMRYIEYPRKTDTHVL